MERIKDVFPRSLKALGLYEEYKRRHCLCHWSDIVGPDVARQSRPLKMERDTLILAVANSAWLNNLFMLKLELIRQINAFENGVIVGDIRFLQRNVTIDRDEEGKPEPHQGRSLHLIRLSQEEELAAENFCATADDILKPKLTRMYRNELKLRKLRLAEGWHACASCGALCPKDEPNCSVCDMSARQLRKSEIRGILDEVPWATYAAIRDHVECTSEEYIDAKTTLLARLAERVQHGQGGELEQKRLTMLFKGVSPDALSDELIQETLRKFRRKTYVSTSRV